MVNAYFIFNSTPPSSPPKVTFLSIKTLFEHTFKIISFQIFSLLLYAVESDELRTGFTSNFPLPSTLNP